jgi:hypothetical protein
MQIVTGLFELFFSDIAQEFWIFEYELPTTTYGIVLIATEAEI